jgi:hypothetical protein
MCPHSRRPQRPFWVIVTTWSRTVIVPTRGLGLSLAATVNETELSPVRGIGVFTVIQDAFDCADQMQRSCNALPHVFGSLSWSTSKLPVPPAATKPNDDRLTAYLQPA